MNPPPDNADHTAALTLAPLCMVSQLRQLAHTYLQALTSGITAANDSYTSNPSNASSEHFVTITDNGDFALGCNTFYPMGWNQ